MDRRTALKGLAAAVTSGLWLPSSVYAQTNQNYFGWDANPDSLAEFIERNDKPFVIQQNAAIKGTGKGKKAFLHLALEKASGRKYRPHQQGTTDCVSCAAGLSVDILSAVQVITKRQPQQWLYEAATEPIHGGSRVEIGHYTGRGSRGHWAAEWVNRYGILLRKEYPGGYDFSTYSAKKAIAYGRKGCPDPLEPLAKLHPVKKTLICRSYSELRDCLYNGYPVMVCSNVGFGDPKCKRDREGFLTRKKSPWYHAMLFAGYDDTYRRPGALCFNSWGYNWVYGPTRGPQPGGTFWIDASTVTSMLRQGDSFAFSSYVGLPKMNIPPYILR
jgi:hypothetical protein